MQACARAIEKCLDLAHDIDVARRDLHGARFALHVHEAYRTIARKRPPRGPRAA